MNVDAELNVADLLPGKFDSMDEALKQGLENEPGIAKMPIPQFAWHTIGSKATQAIRSVLNFNIYEVLARAWRKAPELQQFKDTDKYPPGQERSVLLGKHEISMYLYPDLTIYFGAVDIKDVRFNLEIGAEFRTAELLILNGHIIGIGGADFSAKAQLTYRGVRFHNPYQSKECKLLKSYRFDPPGIKIG